MNNIDIFSHNNAAACTTDGEAIFTVKALNQLAKQTLEHHIGAVVVRGEVSNFALGRSGHVYFSLKDQEAQIRCAFFKGAVTVSQLALSNGDEILAYGLLSLYTPRGDYQLLVNAIEPQGHGQWQREFLRLKEKLFTAGLFETAHKQPLPLLPKQVAVITSAQGAALQDILSVFRRRCPLIPLTVYDAKVQGEQASLELISALEAADTAGHDLIILSRGGGSIEDLWAFNHEQLAYTIFHAKTPIISAVGHEIDFTIADFVADVRAPTPTAAAELASPDQKQLLIHIERCHHRLVEQLVNRLQIATQQLTLLQKKIIHPKMQLTLLHQQLENHTMRVRNFIHKRLNEESWRFNTLNQALQSQVRRLDTAAWEHRLSTLTDKLIHLVQQKLTQAASTLQRNDEKLNIINPLRILSRGYCLAYDAKYVLLDSAQLAKKQTEINLHFHDGELTLSYPPATETDHQ